MGDETNIEGILAAALHKASAKVIPLGLYQGYTLKGKLSAPMIKCKKTPKKKCRFMAEKRKKR